LIVASFVRHARAAAFARCVALCAPGLDGEPRPYRTARERFDAFIATAKVRRAPLNAFLAAPR